MLAALLGDIHANLVAFKAVLKKLDKIKPDWLLSPGDVVGYGPWPNEVCKLARKRKLIVVKGNHDRAVVSGNTEGFNPVAVEAIEWSCKRIFAKNLKWLDQLPLYKPLLLDGVKIFLVHGSPRNEESFLNEYLYPPIPSKLAADFFEKTKADVIVTGHSHIPFVKELRTEKGKKLLIGAGSIGQPRDRDPSASWMLLDSDGSIEQHREEYDVDKVARKISDQGLPESLGDRLYYGW